MLLFECQHALMLHGQATVADDGMTLRPSGIEKEGAPKEKCFIKILKTLIIHSIRNGVTNKSN